MIYLSRDDTLVTSNAVRMWAAPPELRHGQWESPLEPIGHVTLLHTQHMLGRIISKGELVRLAVSEEEGDD